MKGFKNLIFLIACMISFTLSAQTSCDKFYANGVKYQQIMTVASQNRAISYFKKAKLCYDSPTKKDLCDQQITACRNVITQISKKNKSKETTPSPKDNVDSLVTKPKIQKNKTKETDIKLSINCTYLKFKGKGGEFKKAKIICNNSDWEIADKPDWVNCSKSNDEIVVEVVKNPNKQERSGIITIKCGDKSVSLTIIQEKYKKFHII